MAKLGVNRRAHFPVGGKRNTLNFFGHGNRPKKRKGKTAAEEDDDDERPSRRRRHSDHWMLLAAVGTMGAVGTYWAFTHPKEVREAARALGVEDTPVIREALDFIAGGKPEDRQDIERQLRSNAEAEQGANARQPTNEDPYPRTPARPLNQQEAGIVNALKAGGHDKEAKFFAEYVSSVPDVGPLQLPGNPAKDPLAQAGQFFQARTAMDQFRLQAEQEAVAKAPPGASEAEIKQLRLQAAPAAQQRYAEFVAAQPVGETLPFGSREVEEASNQSRAAGFKNLVDSSEQGTLAHFLDPKTIVAAPLYSDLHQALVGAGVTKENYQQKFQENPALKEYFDYAVGHPRMAQAPKGDPALTALRNQAVQEQRASTSGMSSSLWGHLGAAIDRPFLAMNPGAWKVSMPLMVAGQALNERGMLGNRRLIKSPAMEWLARRSEAIMARSQERAAAVKRGDLATVRRLDAAPLPTSASSMEDIQAEAGSAEGWNTTSGVVGTGLQNVVARTMARFATPAQMAKMTGQIGGFFNVLQHYRDPLSAEALADYRDTGIGAGTAAAQTHAIREGWKPGTTALQELTREPAAFNKIRAATAARIKEIPAGANWVSRFGATAGRNLQGLAQQARWTVGVSTSAEVAAAMPKLTEAAVRSPILLQLMRANALRAGVSLASSTAVLGTVIAGAQAGTELGVLAYKGFRGEGHDHVDSVRYQRALQGTIARDGRIEDATGAGDWGGIAGNLRDYSRVPDQLVLGNWSGMAERDAVTGGYSRWRSGGDPQGVFGNIHDLTSGNKDWKTRAEVRGVRDGMFAVMSRNALQRALPIASKIVDGNPLWANASVDKRDHMTMTLAARMMDEQVANFADPNTPILQGDLDAVEAAWKAKAASFKSDPLALADHSGARLAEEADKLTKHFLAPGKNDDLIGEHGLLMSGGIHNAMEQQGVNLDRLIQTGKLDEAVAPTARYIEKHLGQLRNAYGPIGEQFKVHDSVYGVARREVERALDAPELRYMDPQRKREILDATGANQEAVLRPLIEKYVQEHPEDTGFKEFAKPGGILDTTMRQHGWGQSKERSSLSAGGSAEILTGSGLRSLKPYLTPEQSKAWLAPEVIRAQADKNSGVDYETRNNQPEVGLFTANSPQGREIQQRNENWAKDLEAAGIKMPDQAGFDRLVAQARRQGVNLPTRYEDVALEHQKEGTGRAGRVSIEMGPEGPQYVVSGAPGENRTPMNQGQMAAILRTLAEKNPDLVQSLQDPTKRTGITGVLVAQERPWLEKALAAPQGGFTKMGPEGTPAGTVSTWQELQGDILRNPQNYSKAWRPEVQTYIGDWKRYNALQNQPGMVAAPEIAAELDNREAYKRFVDYETKTVKPTWKPQRVLSTGAMEEWRPSMSQEQFSAKFSQDPLHFKGLLSPAAQEWQARYQADQKAMQERRAPTGPGPVPKYAPAPPPKPVQPVGPVAPTPPTQPIGQPKPP